MVLLRDNPPSYNVVPLIVDIVVIVSFGLFFLAVIFILFDFLKR